MLQDTLDFYNNRDCNPILGMLPPPQGGNPLPALPDDTTPTVLMTFGQDPATNSSISTCYSTSTPPITSLTYATSKNGGPPWHLGLLMAQGRNGGMLSNIGNNENSPLEIVSSLMAVQHPASLGVARLLSDAGQNGGLGATIPNSEVVHGNLLGFKIRERVDDQRLAMRNFQQQIVHRAMEEVTSNDSKRAMGGTTIVVMAFGKLLAVAFK